MANYFISPSPTGNDSNVGSAAAPWATLAHAEAVVIAGDTVNINNGTYAGFTTTKNGTSAAARITFIAVSPGNVILTSQITCPNNFRLFDGFVFNNVGDRAFDITGASSVIQNVTININYGVGYGIKIGPDSVSGGTAVSNNVIAGVRIVSTFASTPNQVHGVLIGGGGSGNILKSSYISNTGYGVVNKGAVGTLVMNNVFNFTVGTSTALMYDKGAINGKYYNNTCRSTGGGFGFLVQEDDPGVTGQDSSGAAVRNNIFIKGPDACIQGGIGGTGTFTSNFNVFQFTAGSVLVGNSPGSNYTTLAQWQAANGQDLNSIVGTPTFTNASGTMNLITDYKPAAGSPVINAGTALAEHTSDAGGNAFVGTPDIGAWEAVAAPPPTGNVYYISTAAGASDSNTGLSPTFVSGTNGPWRNFERLNTAPLVAGDTVYIRAGTYNSTATASTQTAVSISGKNGTSTSHITISAYTPDFPGVNARVVYNFNNITRGTLKQNIAFAVSGCTWVDLIGISIIGATQQAGPLGDGTINTCFDIGGGSNITLINCETQNGMTGFSVANTVNTTFTNCDAHNHSDPLTGGPTGPYNNSDGFSRTGIGNTATGTVYNYCRSWNNSDDGWDCIYTPGTITYNGCWAFRNGYSNLTGTAYPDGDGNGFKHGGNAQSQNLSGFSRIVHSCLAAGNKQNGFDQNSGEYNIEGFNNTSINNGGRDFKYGFFPSTTDHSMINNASIGNFDRAVDTGDSAGWGVNHNNSWNSPIVFTTADLQSGASTDYTALAGARQADGSLPIVTYAHLVAGSDLINAGFNVGLPFSGSAPDIGAFETGTPSNIPPTANAGSDKSITLPVTSTSITGTASDSDGTISSTTWSFISGPVTPTISTPNLLTTSVSGLTVAGSYTLRLTVTDNLGASSVDDMAIIVSPGGVGSVYYVSLSGNDSWDGLAPAFVSGTNGPWRNIERINSAPLVAGDTVYIRAGTYTSTTVAASTSDVVISNKHGTASSHIVISTYPPDWTSTTRRVAKLYLNNITHTYKFFVAWMVTGCTYVDIEHITIEGPNQVSIPGPDCTLPAQFVNLNSSNITWNNCECFNSMTGFALGTESGGLSNSVNYSNCDSYFHKDPFTGAPTGPYSGSDGFDRTAATNTASSTTYYGCRSWNNTDDGFDMFDTAGTVTFDHCWSFRNGFDEAEVSRGDGNGFKLGPDNSATGFLRSLVFCVAADNKNHGYDQNTGSFTGQFYNCGAYKNGGNDWKFGYHLELQLHHYFRNNISFGNCPGGVGCIPLAGTQTGVGQDAQFWDQQYNSWQPAGGGYLGANVTSDGADFQSTNYNLLKLPRKQDGSLPDIAEGNTAYHLASSSDCIDKGTPLAYPFNGAAPDLGPFETTPGGTTTTTTTSSTTTTTTAAPGRRARGHIIG